MFGNPVAVPANSSPHLRKSGSRPVVSDLGIPLLIPFGNYDIFLHFSYSV